MNVHEGPQQMAEGKTDLVPSTTISRRGFLKGIAGAGISAALLRPRETRASSGFLSQLPSVEASPEAAALMDQRFEDAAEMTLDNINRFRKWIEKEGGADEFHETFSPVRSEIQQALAYGLTPPELVTDVMAGITNRGPYAYPADFTSGEAKEDKFFGKVKFGPVLTGHNVDENLLIGGEADTVIFGVSFHDFVSKTGAKGKAVLVHFGGANESQAWNASGLWNTVWPNGEFHSSASQFRVETDPSNTQRVWPYDPVDASISYPPPQHGQAGINEMVRCIGNGMASISIGSTYNYDVLMQMDADYKKQNGVSIFDGVAPDFVDREFVFRTNAVGLDLLKRLQLLSVDAMIKEQEISRRELGIVQFGNDGTKQTHIGVEAMRSLFPDVAGSWPRIKPTSYYLDESRSTLIMDDILTLPNILGAKRFAYPQQFPQGFRSVVNPIH
ncbi:MAG: twin-arginine translocation signal domain-containing protein [Candidatus Levybacteria bacterium]|nr:twin-arginine translocation signal domain-containing protein [Candidatus Levybacteria bacterium]